MRVSALRERVGYSSPLSMACFPSRRPGTALGWVAAGDLCGGPLCSGASLAVQRTPFPAPRGSELI